MSDGHITPQTRRTVLMRDGYRCIAPVIDGRAGWCRDLWGNLITRWLERDPGPVYLQMSHVKMADELAMGKKATSDPYHLVALCPHHHTGTIEGTGGSNWEAANRERIRRYLEDIYRQPRRVPGIVNGR